MTGLKYFLNNRNFYLMETVLYFYFHVSPLHPISLNQPTACLDQNNSIAVVVNLKNVNCKRIRISK